MPLPTPQAVVFDMDGLLLDTERVYFEGFRTTLDALGLPQDDDLFRRLVGTNRVLGRRLLTEGLAGRVNLEEFDAVWDAEIAQRLADYIPVKPGARAMAEHLRERDIPYIIATSTQTKKAHLHLERAGLGALFRDVVGGDQVAASKPAPDIYLHATARLGHDPSNCVAFEDSPNGVRAAHAAGLITVQVPDIVAPDAELRALGHHIASNIIAGAHEVGLMVVPE
ncbi:HAD family hydrolase [Ruegeria atlantica]|uniref:Phosphorylated carbohydrates phosphatase n=1 Tax=Ruegeria atlantica TaxID=81569 RepID=A0A0P1EFJ4_9RHOB|nr:HAD family phosphatase [Ruegeria atlantica]CUH48870.1 Phosphorylated carbohydrates phosphatase [Ruegeria atlantica]